MTPPASRPLGGIQAKLDRAAEQIDAIEQDVRGLARGGQYRVTGHAFHDSRQYSFTAYGPPVPLRLSVLAGEAVHHLRSSLDHLVWQLVLANGGRPTERTEFPICVDAQKFAEARSRGKIRGVSANAERQIESLQPYRHPQVHDSWLWVVHELDRIDKHRLLVVVAAAMRIGDRLVVGSKSGALEIVGLSPPRQVVPTEEGVEVFRVHFGEKYQRDVTVESEFELNAVIDQVGPVAKPPLVPLLRQSLAGVRAAIQSFEPEFATA